MLILTFQGRHWRGIPFYAAGAFRFLSILLSGIGVLVRMASRRRFVTVPAFLSLGRGRLGLQKASLGAVVRYLSIAWFGIGVVSMR